MLFEKVSVKLSPNHMILMDFSPYQSREQEKGVRLSPGWSVEGAFEIVLSFGTDYISKWLWLESSKKLILVEVVGYPF